MSVYLLFGEYITREKPKNEQTNIQYNIGLVEKAMTYP